MVLKRGNVAGRRTRLGARAKAAAAELCVTMRMRPSEGCPPNAGLQVGVQDARVLDLRAPPAVCIIIVQEGRGVTQLAGVHARALPRTPTC